MNKQIRYSVSSLRSVAYLAFRVRGGGGGGKRGSEASEGDGWV